MTPSALLVLALLPAATQPDTARPDSALATLYARDSASRLVLTGTTPVNVRRFADAVERARAAR